MRRRISTVLALLLVGSLGMLAGARLQRSVTPGPPALLLIEQGQEVHRAGRELEDRRRNAESFLLAGNCTSPEAARRALASVDPGVDDRGYHVRQACLLLARGLPKLVAALRAMAPADREAVVMQLLEYRALDGALADQLYDLDPRWGAYEAAMWNLFHGREARALVQLRTALARVERPTGDPYYHRRELLLALLVRDALEARLTVPRD